MMTFVLLVGGGLLLYWGAEWFVGGASSLALSLRIPQILVGLTVVAYGTSAPEMIVGIQAARAGHADVALGNIIGSNIANIGLILGIAALIAPAVVDGALRRRELPVLVASTLAVPLFLIDGVISIFESCALLLAAVVYTGLMIVAARRASTLQQAADDTAAIAEAADVAGAPHAGGVLKSGITALVGLAVLLVGGTLFVEGAVDMAIALGMSEKLVGLTVVAIGTSLPELVSSVVAARKGHSDLAVGNVLGSNIFNVLVCLGAAGLAGPIRAELSTLTVELSVLAGFTLLAVFLMRGTRKITRVEGAIAVACYVAFLAWTIVRG